ncbi:MAG: hypothetical protein ACETWM_03230 [Candidatus Lokiarchaeia archaeon]
MKKRSLLLILVLAISLTIPVFLTQTQPVYTQPMTHTYTFQEIVNNTSPPVEVNFTVTIDMGILIEGNVAGWTLKISANSNETIPPFQIQNITINSEYNGTIMSRGLMFPLSNDFESDEKMLPPLPPFNPNYSLVKFENVLLLEDIAGFPSLTSFNLSVTIETTNGPQTVHLASDVPVLSLIFPNPSEAPPEINYYLLILYSMVFLLPISMILTNRWLNIRKLKKEGSEEV